MLAMSKALGPISITMVGWPPKNASQQEENRLPCKPDHMSYILGNLQWKERSDPWKLSCDFHTHTTTHMSTPFPEEPPLEGQSIMALACSIKVLGFAEESGMITWRQ